MIATTIMAAAAFFPTHKNTFYSIMTKRRVIRTKRSETQEDILYNLRFIQVTNKNRRSIFDSLSFILLFLQGVRTLMR